MSTQVTVNSNGQISLGKEYAGQSVEIDIVKPGLWAVKLTPPIPDNEHWLHEPEAKAKLDEALAWAARVAPSDNLAELEDRVCDR